MPAMRVSNHQSVNDQPPARAPHTSVVCPYCGHAQPPGHDCQACRGLFEPLSKQATQNAMGPWRIRDETAPFRPPCSYKTLVSLIKKGRISPDSIISGPTTRQFWARAADTPGVAHLLGACPHCRAEADPSDALCTDCGASFLIEEDRNHLGLAPIKPLTPGTTPSPAIKKPPAVVLAPDPFASLEGGARPTSSTRPSRMSVVVLMVATAMAAVALLMALLREAGQQPTTTGGGSEPASELGPVSSADESRPWMFVI